MQEETNLPDQPEPQGQWLLTITAEAEVTKAGGSQESE